MPSKFWDSYDDGGAGLSFIGKEEKAELINDGTALEIVRVSKGVSKFGPRYIAVVLLDGEERALSFTAESVESRDRLFDSLIEYYKSEEFDENVSVKLEKVGQSIIVKAAE